MFNPGKALGRVMLGTIFISAGVNHARNPEHLEGAVEPAAEKFLGSKDKLPMQPKQAVQAHGATMAVAGTLLALGKFKRLSAATLIGSMAVNTLTGHAFWEEDDAETRANQQIQFFKNVAIAGGLLLQVFDVPAIPHINRGEIKLPDVDLKQALPSTKELKKAKKNVLGALNV